MAPRSVLALGSAALVVCLAWVARPRPVAAVAIEPVTRPNAHAKRREQPRPVFDVAVISDLNENYGSTRYGPAVHAAVGALTERFRPRLVLITGDMVAGQKRGVDAPAMWRAFHRAVTDPLQKAGILLAPAPGNHDASPGFAEERAQYVREWSGKKSPLAFVDASHYPLRYSFTFGGAFFLALDATSVGPLSATQHAWVEQQLQKAGGYPLKVAFGHLPLYPIAHGRERETLRDPELEQLFTRHGVEVYVSGHHHAYYPGATDTLRHLAMPCLGGGARPLIGTQRRSPQALVLLHVTGSELAETEAYAAPDYARPIARATLPAQIKLGRSVLTRDDLISNEAETALSAASR
jgi:acid phosphatase type 7